MSGRDGTGGTQGTTAESGDEQYVSFADTHPPERISHFFAALKSNPKGFHFTMRPMTCTSPGWIRNRNSAPPAAFSTATSRGSVYSFAAATFNLVRTTTST